MTTLVEITEQQTTEYEPTVSDKILRVLFRLDQDEKLISRSLREGDNFCVLGLFADESGQGEWKSQAEIFNIPPAEIETYQYNMEFDMDVSGLLNNTLTEYYNFKDCFGSFDFNDLPKELQNQVRSVVFDIDDINLYTVNDALVESAHEVSEINQILGDIIRSGAIFKKE